MKGHFSIFGALDSLIGAGGVSQTKSFDEQNQTLLESEPWLCLALTTAKSCLNYTYSTAWARGLLGLAASFALTSAAEAARTPNFVLIFMDDQGYQDVGVFGSKTIKTPNLDNMAKEGMKFTNFYSLAPVCLAVPRRVDDRLLPTASGYHRCFVSTPQHRPEPRGNHHC